ncbi:MAG: acyl-CoA mutase large subunit family protein [Verrucomicrobiales bacterium]|jgi:methylmalonyl-CoA mutase|nr:acyl-CoA mutase large subunit family protein [Verrucomicrobiales bacterium]
MSTNTSEPLLSEFAKPSYEQWKVEAEKLLKGVPFEKKMLTRTHEGITLRGIYNPADVQDLAGLDGKPGFAAFTRARNAAGYTGEGWKISQELPLGLPEEFNAAVRHDLLRGLNEVTLLLDIAGARGLDPDHAKVGEVGGCGTSIATVSDLAAAFKGVHLDAVPVYLKAGASALPLTALFLAYLEKTGTDPQKVSGCIENDVLNVLQSGDPLMVSLDQSYDELALLINSAGPKLPNVQFIGVQTLAVANAGANAVQELGYAIAAGASYLAALTARGLDAAEVARRIRFSVSVGGNFFMEIAKLRAARQLWSRVLEAHGVAPATAPMYLHARTAIWNKTRVDANTNMLRVATETFSAALGGVQSLHVGPFDEAFSVPDEFSRRVARNAQIVIQEETEITRVIDPAGGSWYVEWLTDAVAQKAWAFFQQIEQQGGVVASLTAGWLQEQIAAVAKNKIAALEQRRETMVGVNNFPNPKEQLPSPKLPDYAAVHAKRVKAIKEHRTGGEVAADTAILGDLGQLTTADGDARLAAAVSAARQGASLGELTRALRAGDAARAKLTVSPLRITRASLGYEKLREACERAAAAGTPALVFQANLGPSRAYRARADWTTAYFNVGGLTVKADQDFNTIEDAAAAVKISGAKVVIICSTDDKYLEVVEPLAKLLKAADSGVTVLVAGAPGDNATKWQAAGVDDYVHVRTNNYAMLQQVLTKIGALK